MKFSGNLLEFLYWLFEKVAKNSPIVDWYMVLSSKKNRDYLVAITVWCLIALLCLQTLFSFSVICIEEDGCIEIEFGQNACCSKFPQKEQRNAPPPGRKISKEGHCQACTDIPLVQKNAKIRPVDPDHHFWIHGPSNWYKKTFFPQSRKGCSSHGSAQTDSPLQLLSLKTVVLLL